MKKCAAMIFLMILAFLSFQLKSHAQSADEVPIFSFRGVLAGILEEAKELAVSVHNPFAENAASAKPAAEENSFTFAVIGDSQSFEISASNGNLQKTARLIGKKKPDVVIATGDLVSSGDNYTEYIQKFSNWKKVMSPLLAKTYAAMGNHDNIDGKGEKAWQASFNFPTNGPEGYSETVYSFDFKNSHFVFLNSDHEKEHLVDGDQRAWLKQDLDRNKKENVFVIFHEPAFPVSDKGGEGLDADPEERNALWEILIQHKVTAVFNGHEHIVSRRKINDTYQFVYGSTDSFDHNLPAAGIAEFADRGQGRFGIVSVNGKSITVKTYSADDKEIDSFAFTK